MQQFLKYYIIKFQHSLCGEMNIYNNLHFKGILTLLFKYHGDDINWHSKEEDNAAEAVENKTVLFSAIIMRILSRALRCKVKEENGSDYCYQSNDVRNAKLEKSPGEF